MANKDTLIFQKTLALLKAKLRVPKRKTRKPVVVGMVGLTGAGKSTVAKALASKIGATVISGDEIRFALSSQGMEVAAGKYVRSITWELLKVVIKKGGNGVIDSDFIQKDKREESKAKARSLNANIFYVRVYTDFDTLAGRVISTELKGVKKQQDFWDTVNRTWTGVRPVKRAVMKLYEVWRRTPIHYRWTENYTGAWFLKKLGFKLLTELDTTDEKRWKRDLQIAVQKMLRG